MEDFSPFIIKKTDTEYTLTADCDAEAERYGPSFIKYGLQPDGYNWERVAQKLLKKHAPTLHEQLEYVSTAAQFKITTSKKKEILRVAKILHPIFQDSALLDQWLTSSGVWFLKVNARNSFLSSTAMLLAGIIGWIGYKGSLPNGFGLGGFFLIGLLLSIVTNAYFIWQSWKGSEDRPDRRNPGRFKLIFVCLMGLIGYIAWSFLSLSPDKIHSIFLLSVGALILAEIYVIIVNGKL